MMTRYLKDANAISNYFDGLDSGVGMGFSNIDALTHRIVGGVPRFLIREFKHEHEHTPGPQLWALSDLARLEQCTVWIVRKYDDGRIGIRDLSVDASEQIVTTDDYRARVKAWWTQ